MAIKRCRDKYSIKWLVVEKVHGKTKIHRCPFCLVEHELEICNFGSGGVSHLLHR